MSKSLPYILLLAWFSLVIIFNNLQFHRGFLLSKKVIEKNATCVPYREEHAQDDPMCLNQKARVVLLIIDAFRYDFALYDKQIVDPLPYENKVPVISELLTAEPNNTRLYKFLADPPTTTMQRLKALTTGSLPTFTDAGANFASTEIIEDNLISQLVAHNKKVVFMGDDTWTSLYPNHFMRQYPFPSFDVMDLDTVDNGVNKNIYNELKHDDWDLLVAHYLGVDHCGHKFGPDHREMARKLTEMNNAVRKVVENLPRDAVLMVIGDHGMTVTGDHGGDSDLEISSALFVHTKSSLSNQTMESTEDVNQVDLTPTLATILGVPIPYGNIGSLLPDCVPGITPHEQSTATWHNVKQITTYVKHYQDESPDSFNPDDIEKIEREYEALQAIYTNVKKHDTHHGKLYDSSKKFLGEVREMCREVWVEFNPFYMARGLLFIAVISFFVYAMLDGLENPQQFFEFCRNSSSGMYVALLIGGMIAYGGYSVGYFDNFYMSAIFISGLISVFMLPVFLCVYWEEVTVNWHEHRRAFAVDEFVSRIALVISCFAFFSNSYVISEAYVTFSLMCAVFIFIAFESWTKIRKSATRPLIILIIGFFLLSRVTFYYWQCREEHNCDIYTSNRKDSGSQSDWLLSVISVGIIVVVSRAWLKYCGNLSSIDPSVLAYRYFLPIITFTIACFWAIHCFPTRISGIPKWTTDSFAQTSYLLIFSGMILLFLFPSTIYVFYNRHLTTDDGNIIAHLFRNVRSMFNKEEIDDRVPMAWGLGTAYSAPFVMAFTYMTLLFCFLLGIGSAPSGLMLFLSVFVVLAVSSIVRYEKATTIEQMIHVPSSLVVLWVMMASYYFFATGHQATFPNIPWKAAFIGTGGGAFQSNIVPAALIITNIFGSYILMGFSLPMLQLAPLTIYKMIPHLGQKTAHDKKDVTKGEMFVFFQSQDFLLSSTTKLCFKYLIFHVARLLATMLSATIHCRHLMVWRVFTPRLIFESVAMVVTIVSVMLGYIFYVRVVKAIERLVKGIEKQSR